MHSAQLETSDRLQRVDKLLLSGKEYTTQQIIMGAHVCAVNSIIAELRANGRKITCQRRGRHWYYQMQGAGDV